MTNMRTENDAKGNARAGVNRGSRTPIEPPDLG